MTTAERPARRPGRPRAAGIASWAAAGAVGAAVALAIADLPAYRAAERAADELENLGRSGVDNPVTAVLMSFRGYDTLLELSVLFLAAVGIWSAATMARLPAGSPSPVLRVLEQLLIPFLVLFGAYLLWAGSHSAGGAFQAGAVLAAAGVLIALSDAPAPARVPVSALRALIALGLATFLSVAVATTAGGDPLLTYPEAFAKPLILVIEAAATVSIGATLIVAFRGGRPRAASQADVSKRGASS